MRMRGQAQRLYIPGRGSRRMRRAPRNRRTVLLELAAMGVARRQYVRKSGRRRPDPRLYVT